MNVLNSVDKNITSYVIPNNITRLNHQCFSHCTKLSSITIPDSVSELGSNCFETCTKLNSIIISISISRLEYACFCGCMSLYSIAIPNSVTYLGNQCFASCRNLRSITIPDSVSILDNRCFSGCSNLSSITIPTSVSYIGEGCFSGCSNLSSITIPDSVSYIGNGCFSECPKLRIIYTNNSRIIGNQTYLPSDSIILRYEQNPDILRNIVQEKDNEIKSLKQELGKIKQIEPVQIELPQITDDYNPNLIEFNEYIKERSNLIETVHVKSDAKYHESIIDITEELDENIKIKQLELDEYIKVLQNYKTSLVEISSNLISKINQHTQKLKEFQGN